jgi:hypothetical protein
MLGPAALALLFFASFCFHEIAATDAPFFLNQGFFFDFNPPGTTIPIPVTGAVMSSFWFICTTQTAM